MQSITGALAANALWYFLVGLFLMFGPAAVASPLNIPVPAINFYSALGAAATIGFGIAIAGLSRNFTPAAVNGVIIGNAVVIITMLYQMLLVKSDAGNNTGNIVLWIVLVILIVITLAEAALLNQRRRR